MRMTRNVLLKGLLALLTGAGLSLPDAVQAATCGIAGSATATSVTYDPFETTGFTTNVTLSLSRVNGAGGQKTDIVNFYLKGRDADSVGTTVIPTSAVVAGSVEGIGLDIFYDYNEATPAVSPTSLTPGAGARFLKIDFTGNNRDSDTVVVNFAVTLPRNLNATAASELPFDAWFGCSTTGGGSPTQQTGTLANAVRMPINIVSALRAGYVGTALDFGELAQVTNAQAPTVKTLASNYVRVQSSGPYQVSLSAGDSQAYVLTPNGASTTNTAQQIRYSVRFLGQTRSPGNTSAITQTCARAGVGDAVEDRLPVQGTLIDGGSTKNISPNYTENLVVTISPLVAGTAAPTDCGSITL
ncbi:hypothetical protein [Novosphingobium taihuense]|uniref:Repeat protein (TIGR01451 family) n=1 Tax=Novosphingobium taihuense TaxID=260085 RepID=A0A7W7AB01_9SPHN|nr:hypothetical protein [Novosphingobium taihuense]MBB4613567.1 hypothetical protein [Novosphingobium taihuense]TWH81189.1 hypothetical protein IQ25_03576 [Novosphingobium taihuense]